MRYQVCWQCVDQDTTTAQPQSARCYTEQTGPMQSIDSRCSTALPEPVFENSAWRKSVLSISTGESSARLDDVLEPFSIASACTPARSHCISD